MSQSQQAAIFVQFGKSFQRKTDSLRSLLPQFIDPSAAKQMKLCRKRLTAVAEPYEPHADKQREDALGMICMGKSRLLLKQ